jgi:hypothetical protein
VAEEHGGVGDGKKGIVRQKVKTYFLPIEITQKTPAKPDVFL